MWLAGLCLRTLCRPLLRKDVCHPFNILHRIGYVSNICINDYNIDTVHVNNDFPLLLQQFCLGHYQEIVHASLSIFYMLIGQFMDLCAGYFAI